MAGQQQEEIETIRSRTIEVKLSDADVKRISEKAAAHGLTVGELIENFIGDLVCGTYSNGSDERMYAEQWFERCWFGMFPDLTFLRYLIEWGGLDEVIGAWENIKSTEENIQTSEEALASGVMKGRGGRTYTWKDLTNGKGTPCYSSKEEWEQEERTVISDWREEVEADKQTLSEYWNEYTEQKKEYKNGTFEEEMKKVLDYWQEYQSFFLKKEDGKVDEALTDEVVATLDKALHRKRLVSFGFLFKEIHRQLKLDDAENGDLKKTDNEDELRDDLTDIILRYQWNIGIKNYKLVEVVEYDKEKE